MTDVVAAEPNTTYAKKLPGGLRRALVAGRWLPLVGAGLSATAATQDGKHPPSWTEMADLLKEDLAGTVGTPIDMISAFADTYGRAQLVERLSEILHVRHIEPGPAHRAFAKLPFDTVVTTNVDFLLERGYEVERRPCEPLLGESQLSIGRSLEATYLLKFHGDLRHPDELVVTEDDYDGFLRRNPLLTTYLSWWLLAREPVFIGYSLDDADLREILTLLRERLGRMTRPAWAILAADPGNEAPKFERRGIRPIVLDENPEADRAEVLAKFFTELRETWEHWTAPRLEARTDATTAELRRPHVAPQAALFVASPSMTALYRDYVFSSIPQTGLLPIAIDDVRSPDRAMRPMAIDIALSKASVVVYDADRLNPLPVDYVVSKRTDAALVTVHDGESLPMVLRGRESLKRPADIEKWPEMFVEPLVERIRSAKIGTDPATISLKRDTLKAENRYDLLLLTDLALLEAEMRSAETDITAISTSGRGMNRLKAYFGSDYLTVVRAVRLRHDMMQDLKVRHEDLVECTNALAEAMQRRIGVPQIASSA